MRDMAGFNARQRRLATDAFARAAPHLAPILDHQRLRDEPARECRRSAFDAEDLGGEPRVVRRVAHLGQACEQAVAQHEHSRSGGVAIGRPEGLRYGVRIIASG